MSSRRIARTLSITQVAMIVIAAICLLVGFVTQRLHDESVAVQESQLGAQRALAYKLSLAEANIDEDIIQVQQLLTDVSATRELFGAESADWNAARQYATRFDEDIKAARDAAIQAHDRTLLSLLDHISAIFPTYYVLGVKMANIYAKDGPKAGNTLMPEFDRKASVLETAVNGAKIRNTALYEEIVAMSTRLERAANQFNGFALAIDIVLLVFIVGVSLFLAHFIRRTLLSPLDDVTNALFALARGETGTPIGRTNPQGDVGKLAEALELFTQTAIAERNRAEETIIREQKFGADLMSAKLAAESANETKSLFIANMSHELRTPLNAIIGFSSMLLGEVLGPIGNKKYLGYAGDIYNSGQHLLALINTILSMSRLDSGTAELCEEVCNVTDIAKACFKMIEGMAQEAHITLRRTIPESEVCVLADARMLKQIFLNLLTNALKFTKSGGQVLFGAMVTEKGEVLIRVCDTGIGMSQSDVARIGKPFVQIDNRLARKYDGSGLGLSITKRLVELHGGNLIVESEFGKGTTVAVRLPPVRVRSPYVFAPMRSDFCMMECKRNCSFAPAWDEPAARIARPAG